MGYIKYFLVSAVLGGFVFTYNDGTNISNAPGCSCSSDFTQHSVAVDSRNRVHIVWLSDEISDTTSKLLNTYKAKFLTKNINLLKNKDGNSLCRLFYNRSLEMGKTFIDTTGDTTKLTGLSLSYRRSLDGGATFDSVLRLADTIYSPPTISTNNLDAVHIFYTKYAENYHIHYLRSADGGSVWEDTVLYESDSTSSLGGVCMDVSGDNVVHSIWRKTISDTINFIYTHSFNSGLQWSTPVENLVTTPDISITLGEPGDALIPSYAPCPAISSFDNFVHLVWQDSRDDSSGEIYYKRSMDSGQVWSSDSRLTTDSAYSICPTVASSGNSVYIGWLQKEKQDSGFSYYIKHSADGGTSWDSSVCLVPETENLLSIFGTPQVNTRDNFVTVIYGVAEYDSSEGRDIAKTHLKYSNDNGLIWNSITFGAQGCVAYCPSATIDNSGNSHIVWTGGIYQLNTRDIYYAKVSLIAVEENSNIKYQNVKMKIIKNKIFLSVPNDYCPNTLITIYDLSGRPKETLYSGTLTKGDYTFTPNIHKSGIYFVRLNAGNFAETKKLILIK